MTRPVVSQLMRTPLSQWRLFNGHNDDDDDHDDDDEDDDTDDCEYVPSGNPWRDFPCRE